MTDKNELIVNEELPEEAVFHEDIVTNFDEGESSHPPTKSCETKRLVAECHCFLNKE